MLTSGLDDTNRYRRHLFIVGSGEQKIIVTGKKPLSENPGHLVGSVSELATSMIRAPFAPDGGTRFAVMSFCPMALDFNVKPLSLFLYLRSRLLTA